MAPSSAMRSSRSNLFTNCNFTGGTKIGKGGPLLAAKISRYCTQWRILGVISFALGLKGRFYAKLFCVSKGKILRYCCLYVLNGKILRQTTSLPIHVHISVTSYKGNILRHVLFILSPSFTKSVSMVPSTLNFFSRYYSYINMIDHKKILMVS